MKPHVKLYLEYFKFHSLIPCEIENCKIAATDIHHIKARGMGGTKKKEDINNLMALCREHHEKYGDRKQHMEYLIEVHQKYLKKN